jgi:ubiquinone/menaquinone biosynthesis C-methylase UbiE
MSERSGNTESRPGDARAHGAYDQHCVCPAEHAGWLTVPVRRLFQDPRRILHGLIQPGDTVVDLGCGPGYFTLPMAQMAGPQGRVIAVDLQPGMLEKMSARAAAEGLGARITPHLCPADSLGLDDACADFALAFYMVHEVPDAARFLAEVHAALKPGARLLVVEPRPEVHGQAFARLLDITRAAGFTEQRRSRGLLSRGVLLLRP